jgi:hypothetical protein
MLLKKSQMIMRSEARHLYYFSKTKYWDRSLRSRWKAQNPFFSDLRISEGGQGWWRGQLLSCGQSGLQAKAGAQMPNSIPILSKRTCSAADLSLLQSMPAWGRS